MRRLEDFVADIEAKELKEAELYGNSSIHRKLSKQEEAGEDSKALFSDIDNTFYREEQKGAMVRVIEGAAERSIPLVSVTGNGYEGVRQRIEKGELPYFDVIVGAVGTEIWVLREDENGKAYHQDTDYEKMLKEFGYERRDIAEKGASLIGRMGEVHPDAKLDFQEPVQEKQWLEGEEIDRQPYKVSFYFFANESSLDVIAKEISGQYPEHVVTICEEIHYNKTIEEGQDKKYCVDILPISKGGAVTYVSKVLGIKQGLVAGDSGNDVDMLVKTGALNSALVGGYKPEALRSVEQSVQKKRPGKRSFQRITQPDGSVKAMYIEPEPEKRKAAESIERAAMILERAERIKKLKETHG